MEHNIKALLERVRQGDGDEAFSSLCDHFAPMLGALVSRFSDGACEADRAELAQEARIAFFRAAKSYASEDGAVTFGLYARVCVRNALVSFCRARSKQPPLCSIDELDEVLLPHNEEPLGALIEAESLKAMYRKIESVLSSFERRVFDLYIEEETTAAIAVKLGKSEKSVSNALYRVLSKLRNEL